MSDNFNIDATVISQFDDDPNYDVLVDKLYERTVERKIIWEFGDEKNEYIASLKGKTSFNIRRIETNYKYVLTMRNETDEVVFRISHDNLDPASSEALLRLFKLAERIAKQIDDEVDKAIDLLDQLGDDE
ncbi:MAG: hypothetical protein IPP08_06255 [Chlorobiota bacterium]|nr:hypothetical protein [Chlorobiota bacterium]QQS67762.1 MAG: hypothetical protein IPP08_06255 [Chlorobiota bacterium]